MVLTNDEANRSARGYIEESVCFFNPSFIATHSKVDQEVIEKLQELCEDSNKAIRTLIKDLTVASVIFLVVILFGCLGKLFGCSILYGCFLCHLVALKSR